MILRRRSRLDRLRRIPTLMRLHRRLGLPWRVSIRLCLGLLR